MTDADRRIRILVVIVGALAAIAGTCGYLDGIVVTDRSGHSTTWLAGGDQLALFLVAMMIPGIAVFRRPRWTPIVTWIVWTAVCATILFGHYLTWSTEHAIDLALSMPEWPLAIVACCLGVMAILVAIAIPCVRESDHSCTIELPCAQLR